MGDNPPPHHSSVQKPSAQDQSIQNNAYARDVARTIVHTLCVWHCCACRGEELSRFKNSSLLDTPWKKATAVTICLGLLVDVVVFPVLHSTGHLGRIWSSDSGQNATQYINATTIKTGAGVQWDYVGCYQDAIWNNTAPGPEGRTLDGMSLNWVGNMTNELCADACADYQYFGTEYYSQCFCGNKIDSQANLSGENNCRTPCNGNLDEICGGAWNMSIYRNMGQRNLSPNRATIPLAQFPT